MIRPTKSHSGQKFLPVVLALLTAVQIQPAWGAARAESPGTEAAAGPAELAGQLGAEVREIAASSLISRAKKEKRISTAVRVAVVTATTYRKNPAEALAQAIELTQAAAQAAPSFAEVIANAASFTPAISRVDGASARIRSAATAAAKSPGKARPGRARQTARATTAEPPVDAANPPASTRTRRTLPPHGVAVETEEAPLPNPAMVAGSGSPGMGNPTRLALSAKVGVRHDDNIFLTPDKVGDTVFTVTPGLAFQFGQDSLARGFLQYNESFIRYSGKSAPNTSLGAALANFVYDNGNFGVSANASFQQLNQNTNYNAGLGLPPQVYRRDVLDAALNVETPLTAKTRIRTGTRLNQLEYKTGGLVGTREVELPLTFYLETTPKTSVGLGATYRSVKPQGDGPSGHDLYYNVAARGSFTQKLSGELSVGYRTREVAVNPRENLWGFEGALHYEVTGKSNLALQLSRDFSTGALGESLKSNRFALRFNSEPTLQWSFGAMLSYQSSVFGPALFNPVSVPVVLAREDDYWEGSLLTSYILTSWLTATADYTLRKNQSTRPDARYDNNQFNLTLGVRY